MRKQQQNTQQDILFILISSFIVVVAWIGFNLYHIWATSTVSQDIQVQLTPINNSFDPVTIQQIKTREQITPLYEIAETTSASHAADIPTATATSSAANQPIQTSSSINRQGQ